MSLDELLEDATPGPWRPAPLQYEDGTDRKSESLWLTNDAGDWLSIEAEDAALLINAALEKTASRAEAAFTALVDRVVDREITDYIAERRARQRTEREAARSMRADMRGDYEG